MSHQSSFRGIQGIREIKTRMNALVDYYRKFRPDVNELVCSRKDYDLVARWPKAANAEGFLISDSGIFYEGLRLTYDTGQGRYDKTQAPEQTVIT
jgi:hypothetical protein